MMHSLEDCYDRLDRADEHLDGIEGEIKRFLDSEPYSIVRNSYPGSANNVHFVFTVKAREELHRRLRVLIGEFFHNLRSSLDHLAYILATPPSRGDPPPGTEFPIFKDRPLFLSTTKKGDPARGSGLYKMRGMKRGPQTIVKWLQPYRRINDPEGHPLWVIHDMSVGDKHRKSHVMGAVLEGSSIGYGAPMQDVNIGPNQWGPLARTGPFVDGATVGMMTITITGPNPMMNVQPDFTFGVAFDPKGPARGRPVIATLTELRDFVRVEVFPKLEKFV